MTVLYNTIALERSLITSAHQNLAITFQRKNAQCAVFHFKLSVFSDKTISTSLHRAHRQLIVEQSLLFNKLINERNLFLFFLLSLFFSLAFS